jgi:aminoglycoside 3'-phosphotransferase-2
MDHGHERFDVTFSSMFGDELFASLPPGWRNRLASCEVTPVRSGMSSASLFHLRGAKLDDIYLKMGQGADAAEVRSEIERTLWLATRGLPVPSIICSFDGGEVVAVMMTALRGAHPPDCGRPVREVIDILARAMIAFQAEPLAGCPFDETIAARLARAHALLARGGIDSEHFSERNRGKTPLQIYERLLAARPQSEELVLIHGDATFDNILIDAAGNVGFLDCGHCGRGDRAIDLTCMAADIEEHFGTEWAKPFLRYFGVVERNSTKALFFSDLYELF